MSDEEKGLVETQCCWDKDCPLHHLCNEAKEAKTEGVKVCELDF